MNISRWRIFPAIGLMDKHCFMASIDLKDAYYSVNIDEEFRKFLKFEWNNSLYQFTCLPNELSSAPRMFTKLMKPVFSSLRSKGFISVYYLDDSWLAGSTREECLENINATRTLLTEAGFVINEEKSVLTPSQHIQFLGFILDSNSMTVSLPNDKKEKIASICDKLLTETVFSIRFIAHFIGLLVSSFPAIQIGALFYRYLEYDKISALRRNIGNFDCSMSLSDSSKSEVRWWRSNIHSCSQPIHVAPPTLFITTDASLIGWGAVFNHESTGGLWSLEKSQLHINVLE